MKKTLITLILMAGGLYGASQEIKIPAGGDGTSTYSSNGNNGSEYTYIIEESASIAQIQVSTNGANIKKVTIDVAENVNFKVVTKIDLNNRAKTDFEGAITLGSGASMSVGEHIQFNCANGNTEYSTKGSITLGAGATISATYLNFVDGQTSQSLTIEATFSGDNWDALTMTPNKGNIVEQNLITLTEGIKNMAVASDSLILTDIENLTGYKNMGYIASSNVLKAGQYGLLYSTQGIKLVAAAVPEPTTATLSMLALAGLAARRRR